jgi:hypothetical protein
LTKAAIQELDWDWRFFHIRPTLRALLHRITTSSALSLQQSARRSKIGLTTSSRPNRRISSSVGSKTCLNVGRQSWIMENTYWLIVWLFVWKINLEALKKPHELMHQSNNIVFSTYVGTKPTYRRSRLTNRTFLT